MLVDAGLIDAEAEEIREEIAAAAVEGDATEVDLTKVDDEIPIP